MASPSRPNYQPRELENPRKAEVFYRRDHRNADTVTRTSETRVSLPVSHSPRSKSPGLTPKETPNAARQLDSVVKDPLRRRVGTNDQSNPASPTSSIRSPHPDGLAEIEAQGHSHALAKSTLHTQQDVRRGRDTGANAENDMEPVKALVHLIDATSRVVILQDRERSLWNRAESARHVDERNRKLFKEHRTLLEQSTQIRRKAEQEVTTIQRELQVLIEQRDTCAARLKVTFSNDITTSERLAQVVNDVTALQITSKSTANHCQDDFAAKSELNDIKYAMHQLSKEMRELTAVNISQAARVQKLELECISNTEIKVVKERCENLEEQLGKVAQSSKKTNASSLELQASIGSQQEQIRLLTSSLRGSEHSITSLSIRYNNITTEHLTKQWDSQMSAVYVKNAALESYISELCHLRQMFTELESKRVDREEHFKLFAGIEARVRSLEDQYCEADESAVNFRNQVSIEKDKLTQQIGSLDAKFDSLQDDLSQDISEIEKKIATRMDAIENKIWKTEKRAKESSSIFPPVEVVATSLASTSQSSRAHSLTSGRSEHTSDALGSAPSSLLYAHGQVKSGAKRVLGETEKNHLTHLDGWNAVGAPRGTASDDSDVARVVGSQVVAKSKRKLPETTHGSDKDNFEAADENQKPSSTPPFRKIQRR